MSPPYSDLKLLEENNADLPKEVVALIYELSNHGYHKAMHCLANLTLDNILTLVFENTMLYSTEESPTLKISNEYEDSDMCKTFTKVIDFYIMLVLELRSLRKVQ